MPRSVEELRRPISRAEYEAMVEAGVFGEDRVELLYGVIVRTAPATTPRSTASPTLSRGSSRRR